MSNCDGAHHNLDFYVKDNLVGYTHYPRRCVGGTNMRKFAQTTIQKCADLCEQDSKCKGFEYGVNYGGKGGYKAADCQLNSSSQMSDCDGAHHNLDFYVKDKALVGYIDDDCDGIRESS